MWDVIVQVFSHPTVQLALDGAKDGFLVAAAIDRAAFKKFTSLDDLATFNWKTAAKRWAFGALAGGLLALGI